VIALTDHPDGVLVAVRAQPNARKTGLLGVQAGAIKLAVTAPPEDGRANAAIVELMRELLGLKRSQVELSSGATGRNKKLLIRGLPKAELAANLAALFTN
jgi:uncharacterized protein (TIGR00251 family)